MKILIPGGAGYIGSHMVKLAQELNHDVVVLDNFSSGHKWAVSDCEIIEVDLLDQEELSRKLHKRKFDVVIHFAAKSIVSESIINPQKYYLNNVCGSLNLLNTMLQNNIYNIVFSSTAAIFGNPHSDKIKENHPKIPINSYGRSKLMVENILSDYCDAKEFNAVALRYFNAAGAHPGGGIGEKHCPETHLIPNILNSINNKSINLEIYGNDYDTSDGTCIRDYIHVNDLVAAHMLGIDFMKENVGFSSFNLGNGDGFSVFDIIKSCERVTNTNIKYKISSRRKGDPKTLVSDSKLANEMLKWEPAYKSIDDIIETAWNWHSNLI